MCNAYTFVSILLDGLIDSLIDYLSYPYPFLSFYYYILCIMYNVLYILFASFSSQHGAWTLIIITITITITIIIINNYYINYSILIVMKIVFFQVNY